MLACVSYNILYSVLQLRDLKAMLGQPAVGVYTHQSKMHTWSCVINHVHQHTEADVQTCRRVAWLLALLSTPDILFHKTHNNLAFPRSEHFL